MTRASRNRLGLGLGLGLAIGSAMVAIGFASPARAARDGRVVAGAEAPKGGGGYSVIDLEAIKKRLLQGRGHVVVVHFWASWCSPCLEELPLVDRLARDMKPRGLEVLSLSLDNPRTAGPRVGSLLRKVAPNLTTTIAQFDDAEGFISAFDPRWEGAIPALFAYDPEGRLRGSLIGESTRAELEGFVGGLLEPAASKPPPGLKPGARVPPAPAPR